MFLYKKVTQSRSLVKNNKCHLQKLLRDIFFVYIAEDMENKHFIAKAVCGENKITQIFHINKTQNLSTLKTGEAIKKENLHFISERVSAANCVLISEQILNPGTY